MEFEWDPKKATYNLVKHGVPFEYATRVFLDPHHYDREDRRRTYGEERRIIVGEIEHRVFVVVYTRRSSVIRLISARKANARETKKYHELSA